jgi:DNA transformation protein
MPKPPSPFVESLLDLLAPMGGAEARRMFGGYGIYKDGLFIGLVDGEQLYLRVDDETRSRFEERGLPPFTFTYPDGRVITMKYHLAPEEAFSSPMRMKPWAQLAIEAASRAADEKPKRRQKRKAPAKKQTGHSLRHLAACSSSRAA